MRLFIIFFLFAKSMENYVAAFYPDYSENYTIENYNHTFNIFSYCNVLEFQKKFKRMFGDLIFSILKFHIINDNIILNTDSFIHTMNKIINIISKDIDLLKSGNCTFNYMDTYVKFNECCIPHELYTLFSHVNEFIFEIHEGEEIYIESLNIICNKLQFIIYELFDRCLYDIKNKNTISVYNLTYIFEELF